MKKDLWQPTVADCTNRIQVEMSVPRIVKQAPVGETRWGYYQFPDLCFTESGAIRAR